MWKTGVEELQIMNQRRLRGHGRPSIHPPTRDSVLTSPVSANAFTACSQLARASSNRRTSARVLPRLPHAMPSPCRSLSGEPGPR